MNSDPKLKAAALAPADIARRVAREIPPGGAVNLGIGVPTQVANYVEPGRGVMFMAENGILGAGPRPAPGEEDWDLINASREPVTAVPGASMFGHADSFAMIRGGHVDVTVLGALQVSEKGDLANWMLPERGVGNVGGAMDLAAGARRVIVAMEHSDKKGNPKVVRECTYPLTGTECVSLIVTDIAVMEVTARGLVLREVVPGWTAEEVQAETEARLVVPPDLKDIEL